MRSNPKLKEGDKEGVPAKFLTFEGSSRNLGGRDKEGVFSLKLFNFEGSNQKLKGGDKEGVFLLSFQLWGGLDLVRRPVRFLLTFGGPVKLLLSLRGSTQS